MTEMRRGELIINLVFGFGLPLIVFAVAVNATVVFLTKASVEYELIMFLCWAVGFGLFLKSKISVYRQGRLLSFGSEGMTKLNRFCYRAGYAVMLIALFLSLILYMVFRVRA
jgi:hypothetical protein